jgi:Pyruvate/2-oxoacid:ferredoxin oxidoreductase delta subunit
VLRGLPEDAIAKLGPSKRYQYIYELCTGCAICFEQCLSVPFVSMIPEPSPVA